MLIGLTASNAAVQQQLSGIAGDQGAVRERLHELSNNIQPLMILPERLKDLTEQNRETKKQMDDISNRLRVLEPLPERVAKLETVSETLVADQNKVKGAWWFVGIVTGAAAAGASALIELYRK